MDIMEEHYDEYIRNRYFPTAPAAEDLEHMWIVKSRMLLGNGEKDDIIRPFPGKIAGLCIRQVVHFFHDLEYVLPCSFGNGRLVVDDFGYRCDRYPGLLCDVLDRDRHCDSHLFLYMCHNGITFT